MKTERLPITDLIDAKLIYDYIPGAGPVIPNKLLPEAEDPWEKIDEAGQFQGTVAEKLAEISGRACYDSFGRGRTSESFHQHILEVRHGSVYEHFNFTVEVVTENSEILSQVLMSVMNRPNIWTRVVSPNKVRLTLNMRHVVEWHFWTQQSDIPGCGTREVAHVLGAKIRVYVNQFLAPRVAVLGSDDDEWEDPVGVCSVRQVEPETNEEKWITMLLTGSRGFSHELVRHGDRSAISQRSTRYVDENESPWVWHPLIMQYIDEELEADGMRFRDALACVEDDSKVLYGKIVETLQPWMKEKLIEASGGRENMDKSQVRNIGFSARKQARGAARGFLGNSLYTEVVFSASVGQWNRILRQRAGVAADAEIRESFAEKVLPLLQASQYADSFAHWELIECEDGIGKAGVERTIIEGDQA